MTEQKTTIKDLAMQESTRTYKRIEDFQAISIHNEISDRTVMTSNGKEFTFKEISLYDEDMDTIYGVRIPSSVIRGIRVLLEDNPDLEYFRVLKSGEGINTRYSVLPANGVEWDPIIIIF